MHVLEGHEGGISDLSWTYDSRYLCTGSDDKTVRIWDVTQVCFAVCVFFLSFFSSLMSTRSRVQGDLVKTLEGHTSYVMCVNFNFQVRMSLRPTRSLSPDGLFCCPVPPVPRPRRPPSTPPHDVLAAVQHAGQRFL